MARFKVLVCEFPYGGVTHHTVSDWITDTLIKMREDPRIGPGNAYRWRGIDTPVDMLRNRAMVAAEENKVDYVLMVDSDMMPDQALVMGEEGARPFWDTAWEFALAHHGPCVVAAPYCGPPPNENVYAFRWKDHETRGANPNFKLEQFTRFEAAGLTGVREAAAAATGLILIDMRGVSRLKHPRFYYEWTDQRKVHKASTEDVTFTRDCSLAGVPVYVAWDCWAGHWKQKCVPRPVYVTPSDVGRHLLDAARFEESLRPAGAPAADVDVPSTADWLSAADEAPAAGRRACLDAAPLPGPGGVSRG